MKILVAFLASLALSLAAPQPKKSFHKQVENYMDLIMNEVGDDLHNIFEKYPEFEKFRKTLEYMQTAEFKALVYKLESLPEFKPVLEVLKNKNIDMKYDIDLFDTGSEEVTPRFRRQLSGNLKSLIAEFPKNKLSALLYQKMDEDEMFRNTVRNNINSNLMDEAWAILCANEEFKAEIQNLLDQGISWDTLKKEIEYYIYLILYGPFGPN